MARGGYIKLYRSIADWEWFQDSNTYRLFTYLLILANTEEKRWQGIDVKRGELVTSSITLAKSLNMGRTQVRVSLKKLEGSEITSKVTNKYTLIRINNYELYQGKENNAQEEEPAEQPTSQPTSNQQLTSNRPTSNQQLTTIKKHKKQEETKETEEGGTLSRTTPVKKISYGETVKLTALEYDELVARVGEAGAARCIEILDGFKSSKGKKYQSDMGAIRNWVLTRYQEEQTKARASPAVNGARQWPMTIAERNAASRDRSLKNIADYLKQEEQKDAGRNAGNETGGWESLGAGHNLLPGQD